MNAEYVSTIRPDIRLTISHAEATLLHDLSLRNVSIPKVVEDTLGKTEVRRLLDALGVALGPLVKQTT